MVAGLCRYAAALVLIGIPLDAVAQVIPQSVAPGQQRERFVQPPAVQAQPRGSVITLPSTLAPPGAETIKLTIRGVSVVGATVYSEQDLAPLYADLIGREVPLQAVYDLAQRITAKYGRDGYVLTRAVVPPQDLKAGGAVVRIQVIEGYIDKVVWPQKLARFRDFFTYYAAKIVADRPANIRTLERYLLLLGDLPGFKVSTKLQASTTELAASTLVVEVTEKPLDVSGRVDNHGSQPQGPGEFLGSATVNNFLGGHEAFTSTYAGAMPLRELQYAAATYRQVLSPEGLTAFITGSYTWGWPGLPVPRKLLYKTWNPYAEAGLSYPVVRSREKNLTLTGLAFVNDASSDILESANTRDRLRGVQLKADGDLADQFRGINQVNVTFSQGIEGLGSTDNHNPISSRPDVGRVDFTKLEFTYSRLQPLFWNFSAFVSVYGQHAFNPLLTPEQCAYGGRFYGRAYDPSQLLGDSCLFELGELRLDMPTPPGLFSLAQLYGFADHGRLTNLGVEPTSAIRTEEGTSVGAGIRFGWANQVNTDFYVARALQGVPFLGVREDTRVFFIATARN